MTSAYHEYRKWFEQQYGRPLACSEAEFNAAIAQPPTTPANLLDDPSYLDGEEDRKGLYR